MDILIVEDDVRWAELVIELFNVGGLDCTVKHAKDGIDALEILSRGDPPDLIISDMWMPRMDGHGLLMEVKSNSFLSGIPFIILSGESCSKERIASHQCKAACHIAKSQFIAHKMAFISCFKELILTADQEYFESRLDILGHNRSGSNSGTVNFS